MRRVTPLNVGGAFHTPLMADATAGLAARGRRPRAGRPARRPVVSNHDAVAYADADGWRDRLADHVSVPVRWRSTMDTLVGLGATTFLEVGHGSMLAALAKRGAPTVTVRNIATPDDIPTITGGRLTHGSPVDPRRRAPRPRAHDHRPVGGRVPPARRRRRRRRSSTRARPSATSTVPAPPRPCAARSAASSSGMLVHRGRAAPRGPARRLAPSRLSMRACHRRVGHRAPRAATHQRRARAPRRHQRPVDRRAHRHPRTPRRRRGRDDRQPRDRGGRRRDQARRAHPRRHRPPHRRHRDDRAADPPHRRVRRRRPRASAAVRSTSTPAAPGSSTSWWSARRCSPPATSTTCSSSDRRRCRGSSTRPTAARASSSATALQQWCSAPRPDDGPGLLAWDLGCDGSATGLLEIPAGGSRRPTTAETVADGEHYLKMAGPGGVPARGADRRRLGDGRARHAPASRSTTSPGSRRTRPTSVSSRPQARRLGIPAERTLVNIDRYGNTSAASIPLVLAEAADAGRLARRRPRAALRLRRRAHLGQRRCCAGAARDRFGSRLAGRVRHGRVTRDRTCDRGRAGRRRPPGRVLLLVGSRRRQGDRRPRSKRPAREALAVQADVADADVGRPRLHRDRGRVRAGRAAREQRRDHARRPAHAHDRRALGRGAADQPHRRVPHHPAGDAQDDAGPLRADRQRVVGERPGRARPGRPTTRRPRPGWWASPGPSPGSWRPAASPATSWPPGLS